MPSAALRAIAPAFSHVPEYVETYGPEVADLAALAGLDPDPEQESLLDATFAINGAGLSAFYEVDVIACRQNLKTAYLKMAALGWLYITEQGLVVWSAHEFDTTKEAFRDLKELIESTECLSKRLASGPSNGFFQSAADTHIELATGQRVKFKARTNSGGRGLSGDKVILDEGFAVQPSHLGSLQPAISARPDPQIVTASSAGQVQSAVLRAKRDRGRAGLSPRQAYYEWAAPENSCEDPECLHIWPIAKGCALDRRDFWLMGNPAMGRRITEETIQAEREVLDPAEFARERLGWWDDPTAAGPFPAGIWQARAADDPIDPRTGLAASQIVGKPTVALDMAWDRRSCALAVAGLRADGKIQGEVVEDVPVTPLNVVEMAASVVRNHGAIGVWLEPTSAAGSLIPALKQARVRVLEVKAAAVNQACGFIFDAVLDGSFTHLGQATLDTAVGGTQKRNSGESWRWDRKTGADISPFMAVTFATWGAAGRRRGGGRVVILDD